MKKETVDKYMQYLYITRYLLEMIFHPKKQEIDQKKISGSIMGDSDISVDLVLKRKQRTPHVTG